MIYFPVSLYFTLLACQVFLRRNAVFTARASSKGRHLAGGGIVQIVSRDNDVRGIRESIFNVTGCTLGLVNILGERSRSEWFIDYK